eukprot:sb/3463557/
MEMTTIISAEFATSSIDSAFTKSDKTNFKEFVWYFKVSKNKDFLQAFLGCEPLQSTKEWMCLTSFSLSEKSLGKCMKSSVAKYSNMTKELGWDKFMPWTDLVGKETLSLEFEITIKDSYLGPPNVTETKSNVVIFHRLVKEFAFSSKTTTTHYENGFSWIAEGQTFNGCLKFVVKRYNKEGKLQSNLTSGAVVVTVKGPSIIGTKSGDLGEEFLFVNWINPQSVVTFLIHDKVPYSFKAEIQKGFNFGKEYLSLPTHGNFSLKDSSQIPLNSYILAENSPVLKSIIETEGTLDHDVSDFDPNSVRIFVDACYTGTLDMLSDTTDFKIFIDFVKMVAVFKVDWAKKGITEFFEKNLPKPLDDFCGYWDYAVLALDSAINYANGSLLGYLLSCPPQNKTKFQFHLFPLVTVITKRSHLDLLMAMLVEFHLVGEFMKQLLILLMVGNKIPLLNYWLENFNFSLCDKEMMNLLTEALGPITSPAVCCKLMTALDEESKQTDGDRIIEDRLMDNIELIQSDGTLATVARNHWIKIVSSTWPCSKERPFSLVKRNLRETIEEK